MSAPSIFVSYAHADADALKQLKKHFAPLEREGLARLWADEAIDFGDDWDEEIAAALNGCRYAVPVLSAAFFASKYIAEKESDEFAASGMERRRADSRRWSAIAA